MARDKANATNVSGNMADLLNQEVSEKSLEDAEEAQIVSVETADLKILDEHSTAEVLNMIQGLFEPEVVYNIPRRTRSGGGRRHWPACDRIPGGCPYDGDYHVHIVDVGIKGARIAAQTYGGLEYGPLNMPTIVEMGGKAYWTVEVACVDTIRGLKVNHWQFEEVIKKTRGGGFHEIEYGPAVVQSKGLRNVILNVIPPQLKRLWIKDYLSGRESFDPSHILDLPGGRKSMASGNSDKRSIPQNTGKSDNKRPQVKNVTVSQPSDQNKAEEPPPVEGSAGMDLKQMTNVLAKKMGVDASELEGFSTSYDTQAKAMLDFARANNDEDEMNQLKARFTAWKGADSE